MYDVGARPDLTQAMATLTFPVIAKPSNAEAYAAVTFPGKKKVHSAADAAELERLIGALHDAGYRDKFILQDVIPGDDQGMRLLTCYVDKQGSVKFAAYGRVLLVEHSPETLGIPAAILTGTDHEAAAHATRLLEHVGWRGYANFDMKYDPRTGRTVFFELQPAARRDVVLHHGRRFLTPCSSMSTNGCAGRTCPTGRWWRRATNTCSPRSRCACCSAT